MGLDRPGGRQSLIIALRPSRTLLSLTLASHGCAVGALWLSALEPLLCLLLLTLLLLSGFRYLRYWREDGAGHVSALLISGANCLLSRGGSLQRGLLRVCYNTTLLQVLVFIPERGPSVCRRRWVVILPDSASADSRRRLRACLRWSAGENSPD